MALNNLIFFGDLVWPEKGCIDLEPIMAITYGKQLVVNLEGAILSAPLSEWKVNNSFKKSLHSAAEVIEDVMHEVGVVACSLGNNHISDYRGGVDTTTELLTNSGIQYFGTSAQQSVELICDGVRYILLGACSRLTEPKAYRGDSAAKIFNPHKLLRKIRHTRNENPDAKIVCVIHWGYELSLYPEPADREWAHRAVEAGADCIIGHHPHVAQGVEYVGKGLVAYSLGNFAMPNGWFNGQFIGFRNPGVSVGLGVELHSAGSQLHFFRYIQEPSRLEPLESRFEIETLRQELTPFEGMSTLEYRKWFASHGVRGHLTPRRSGPVYRSYFGLQRPTAAMNDLYMLMKRGLRKVLISRGLHTPRVS